MLWWMPRCPWMRRMAVLTRNDVQPSTVSISTVSAPQTAQRLRRHGGGSASGGVRGGGRWGGCRRARLRAGKSPRLAARPILSEYSPTMFDLLVYSPLVLRAFATVIGAGLYFLFLIHDQQ